MDYLVSIDSALTLNETETRCEVEQNSGYQLDNVKYGTVIHNGSVFTVNKAEFNSVSSVDILNDLSIIVLGSSDPEKIKKNKKDQGWTFICNTEIYVTNNITRVLVFGKQTP